MDYRKTQDLKNLENNFSFSWPGPCQKHRKKMKATHQTWNPAWAGWGWLAVASALHIIFNGTIQNEGNWYEKNDTDNFLSKDKPNYEIGWFIWPITMKIVE